MTWSAVVLVALSATAAAPVEVSSVIGGQPAATVKPTGAPVHLPACRAVVWEVFQPGSKAYVNLPVEPCGPMAPALRLEGEISITLDSIPPGAQVVRPVVSVGVGCKDDLPIALAECKEVVVVLGPNITVRKTQED